MAPAALIGYCALLALTFGVRTVLHNRRTGETGWLRPPTPAARVGDILFAAGALATVAAPVLEIVGALHPIKALDAFAVNAAGTGLLACGSAVAVVAQAQMGTAWRAGIDISAEYQLVQCGLFSIVRNPFYLGMMAAGFGVAGMNPNAAALVGAAAVVAGCEIDVRLVEEPHLRAAHGDTYKSYTASTPRFVPNPLRRVPR